MQLPPSPEFTEGLKEARRHIAAMVADAHANEAMTEHSRELLLTSRDALYRASERMAGRLAG